MHDLTEYRIEIQGQIDVSAFNITSPFQISAVEERGSATEFDVCTDQSGLVGLIRHIHRQGYVLWGIKRLQSSHGQERKAAQ